MTEISPILSGKYSAPDYVPSVSNINRATVDTTDASGSVDDTNNISPTSSNYVDPRRYTKFDHSAAQVQDAPDFSFGDFLDMVNPLQHIPVVSSVYRSITGDTIHPAARVAGDILYGGALGGVSAAISGVTAIGDAVSESQTGHDTTGLALASIFGEDAIKTTGGTQLATNDATSTAATAATTAPTTTVAVTPAPTNDNAVANTALAAATTATQPTNQAAVQPATQKVPQTPDEWLALANTINNDPKMAQAVTSAPLAGIDKTDATKAAVQTADNTDTTTSVAQAKAFPLNRAAYGGVMAPTSTTDNIEQQNRIIGLSQGSHAMRMGNMIYTGRLMNGPHPMPVAQAGKTDTAATTTSTDAQTNSTSTQSAASATANSTNSANTAQAQTAQHNPIPQNLIDDMMMMKAIGQYQGTALVGNRATPMGSSLDLSN